MAAALPEDLLHMICASLLEQKDFDTLYQCSLSGKQLAVHALASLYRMHDEAPIIGAGGDETVASGKEKATQKWANLWRSIILSSLGKTVFPYVHYIRTLRFQDLESLLDDGTFLDRFSNNFFAKDLSDYRVEMAVTVVKGGSKTTVVRRDTSGTLNCFAQGPINASLTGASVLMTRNEDDADQQFATFLGDIRAQTLQSLEVYSTSKIGAESFLALSRHRDSLALLHLDSIEMTSMQYLSHLTVCTNLKSLKLAENGRATQDLKRRHNDVFVELIDWLCRCKSLKAISISNFINATALLTPALSERGINIVSLELEGYSMPNTSSDDFHRALALQTNLRSLYLKGEGSEGTLHNDILVESLSSLVNLVDLRLSLIAEGFLEYHIHALAGALSKLETFWTGGYCITDRIWPDIALLRSLKRLELSADTRFTANGILDFILSLGPGNKGFVLNVMMQDADCDISEEDQAVIKETLSSRVGGKFDFLLFRAQNTLGVRGIHHVPTDFVVQQIDTVFDDIGVDVVKIGTSQSGRLILQPFQRRCHSPRLVLDPVMVSTSGAQLLPDDAVRNLCEHLLPLATILTPNIPEAHLLLQNAGVDIPAINSIHELVRMAEQTQKLGPRHVLLKGGHLPLKENGEIAKHEHEQERIINVLHDGAKAVILEADYIASKNTHGTGCSLASAIASQMALYPDLDIKEHVRAACQYVEMGIKTGVDWDLGKGVGPINHFHSDSDKASLRMYTYDQHS
ncbi:MAG: hypothetical protein Q9163_000340 [Psora crenata]